MYAAFRTSMVSGVRHGLHSWQSGDMQLLQQSFLAHTAGNTIRFFSVTCIASSSLDLIKHMYIHIYNITTEFRI